ncbi:hypothetical protein [Rossellomorea marisflavi]|uniref:hypothetical protein n=1 Tax=Rossellomorea marisflavi TaxID=189381 RepID=UPI001E35F7F2|nr:hypothetical protein [Rossellomorea marisflavi]
MVTDLFTGKVAVIVKVSASSSNRSPLTAAVKAACIVVYSRVDPTLRVFPVKEGTGLFAGGTGSCSL